MNIECKYNFEEKLISKNLPKFNVLKYVEELYTFKTLSKVVVVQ